jgi:hypothetical protein
METPVALQQYYQWLQTHETSELDSLSSAQKQDLVIQLNRQCDWVFLIHYLVHTSTAVIWPPSFIREHRIEKIAEKPWFHIDKQTRIITLTEATRAVLHEFYRHNPEFRFEPPASHQTLQD